MFDCEKREFVVVTNSKGQYSIWPRGKMIPGGWESEDFVGRKKACVEYIDRVWLDMRPRSARAVDPENVIEKR